MNQNSYQNHPLSFKVFDNYPNPFNPLTNLKFSIPFGTYVTIKVYDLLGREIATLLNNEFKTKGIYNVTFDGSNFASGIYIYSIKAGKFTDSKKMVLIK